MSSSEVGHCLRFAEEPVPPEAEPQSPVQAPAPPKKKKKTGGGEDDDEEEECESPVPSPKRSPKKSPQPEHRHTSEGMDPAARERKEMVCRIAALNTDLVDLQHKLQNRLQESKLEASFKEKEKVFGLVAAFLDDSCLEFARRVQGKATLQSALENTLWWLQDLGQPSLAVPPSVQGMVVRSAIGYDAAAVREIVKSELFPRLRQTLMKLRAKRAGRSGSMQLTSEMEICLIAAEDKINSSLYPKV